MFCEHCGTELKKNAKFCPECGHKVDSSSDEHVSTYIEQKMGNTGEKLLDMFTSIKDNMNENLNSPGLLAYVASEKKKYDIAIKILYVYEFLIIFFIPISSLSELSSAMPSNFLTNTVSVTTDLLTIIMAALIVSIICLSLYVHWKAKVFTYLFKMIFGLTLSIIIIGTLSYITNGFFGIICIPLSLYANRKRLMILLKYKRYLGYLVKLFFISFLPYLFLLLYFLFALISPMTVLRNQDLFILILLACFIVPYIAIFRHIIRFLRSEERAGVPFLQSIYLQNVVCFTLIFTLIGIIGFVVSATWLGTENALAYDGFNGNFDSSSDLLTNSSPHITDSIPDFSTTVSDTSDAATSSMDANFTVSDINTSIFANIPEMSSYAFDPGVLAQYASQNNIDASFYNSDGVPIMKLQDGNILDGTDTSIGSYHYNETSQCTDFTDVNGKLNFSIGSDGYYYTDQGVPIGKLEKAGAMDIFTSHDGSTVYKINSTNTVFDSHGNILGSIKKN